ncbi:MAG: transposase, partial [Thermostichus sp. DG02_5_bins_236]
NLKSVTSRKIRSEFPQEVDKVYWKNVLWNESYFIASCGGVTVPVLKNTSKTKMPRLIRWVGLVMRKAQATPTVAS